MSTPPQCPPCNASSQPQQWDDEVNALNVALMTMRGEGGGFSEDEKQAAINTLQKMLTERIKSSPPPLP